MSFFSAENIAAGYGSRAVIDDISFQAEAGTLTGIIGANGSGKTTLLKALCGILPHGGICRLEDTVLEHQSPRQLARLCSYIPQRSGISIDVSALDVALMGFNPRLGLLEHPSSIMRERAAQALAQVGLSGRENENYMHLSEGQKQLCIFARTLVSDSKLLLLDEPESALDFRFRYRLLSLLRQWAEVGGRAAIVTLHGPDLALNCCDKLLLLKGGGILGTIAPRSDPLDKTESLLSAVYGKISLQRCFSRSGTPHLIMLKEDEP